MNKKPNWIAIIAGARVAVRNRCKALNKYEPDYISLTKVIDEIKTRRRWQSKQQIELSIRNHLKNNQQFRIHKAQGETFIWHRIPSLGETI